MGVIIKETKLFKMVSNDFHKLQKKIWEKDLKETSTKKLEEYLRKLEIIYLFWMNVFRNQNITNHRDIIIDIMIIGNYLDIKKELDKRGEKNEK